MNGIDTYHEARQLEPTVSLSRRQALQMWGERESFVPAVKLSV